MNIWKEEEIELIPLQKRNIWKVDCTRRDNCIYPMKNLSRLRIGKVMREHRLRGCNKKILIISGRGLLNKLASTELRIRERESHLQQITVSRSTSSRPSSFFPPPTSSLRLPPSTSPSSLLLPPLAVPEGSLGSSSFHPSPYLDSSSSMIYTDQEFHHRPTITVFPAYPDLLNHTTVEGGSETSGSIRSPDRTGESPPRPESRRILAGPVGWSARTTKELIANRKLASNEKRVDTLV